MRQITLSSMVLVMILGLAPTAGATTYWEITAAEGDLLLLPDQEVDWRLAAPADQLRTGDRLWAAPSGRAAVAGPAGLQLRLDRGTQIQRVSDGDRQIFALLSGGIYVKHPDIENERMDFVLTAGHVSFRSQIPTIMRVDLLDDGTVSVAVQKGEVLVTTAADNAWLHSGERADVLRTGVIGGPKAILLTDRDAFDEWNEEQDLRLARRESQPDPADPELAQLDGYGDWVQVASYGRAWQPRVVAGWQPYFYGQWVWVSSYGWNWVSAEPWGWLPNHYGQWAWDGIYGWVWIPGTVWAPAWVIWTPYQGGWAWAPYGPFGIPVSIAWHYWCWTADVSQPGWQHHRAVGTVPPSAHHGSGGIQVQWPKAQPPHRSDGDRRRNEQLASVASPRGSAGRRGGNDSVALVEQRDERAGRPTTPSLNEPGEPTRIDRDRRKGREQESDQKTEQKQNAPETTYFKGPERAVGQDSGQPVRQNPGRTARPDETSRQEPVARRSMDRLDRSARQTPSRLQDTTTTSRQPTRSNTPQLERPPQLAERSAARGASDSSGNPGRSSTGVSANARHAAPSSPPPDANRRTQGGDSVSTGGDASSGGLTRQGGMAVGRPN